MVGERGVKSSMPSIPPEADPVPLRTRRVLRAVAIVLLLAGPVAADARTTYDLGDTPAGRLPEGVPIVLEQGESIRWDPERRVLSARGDVRLTWGPYRLQADRMQFFQDERRLVARGNLMAQTPQFDRMRARRVELVRPSDRIRVRRLEGRMPVPDRKGARSPWFVEAGRVDGQPDTLLKGRGMGFTTCNLKTPHYDFRASTVYFYPNNVLVGYHATLNLGGWPVLYFPVFVIDLKDRLKRWEIRPGYSDRDGYELELNYHYLLEEDEGPFTSTVYTDFRENAGAGGGLDVGYEDERGSAYLFGFMARRNPTLVDASGEEVRSDTEQTLLRLQSDVDYRFGEESPWSTQVHADWIENNRFDQDFRSSVGGRAQPTRSLDASLIRTGDHALFRVDGRREDRFNETIGPDGAFVTRREVLPRVRYQLFSTPLELFGRRLFYSSDNIVEKRRPDNGTDRTLWNVALENDLTHVVSHSPAFSQSYTLGYDQDFVEQPTAGGEEIQPVGSGRFRWRNFVTLTPRWDVELNYGLEKRLNRQDSAPLTLNARPLGFEADGFAAHDLGFITRWQNDRVFAFFRTGYDLRDGATVDVAADSRVIDPTLNLRVQITPFWRWQQWVRYGWADGDVQQLNTTWRFDATRDLSLAFDWNFTRTAPGFDNLSELGSRFFWRSGDDRWRLRGDLVWDTKRSEFEETRMTLYRRLHQWEMRFYYRRIENRDNEFWVLFNLRGYPSTAVGLASELPEFSPEFEQRGLQELGP